MNQSTFTDRRPSVIAALRLAAGECIDEVAAEMVNLAGELSPVDTGALAASWYQRGPKQDGYEAAKGVVAARRGENYVAEAAPKPDGSNAVVSSAANYAQYVEEKQGQHMLLQASEAMRANFSKRVADKIRPFLEGTGVR